MKKFKVYAPIGGLNSDHLQAYTPGWFTKRHGQGLHTIQLLVCLMEKNK